VMRLGVYVCLRLAIAGIRDKGETGDIGTGSRREARRSSSELDPTLWLLPRSIDRLNSGFGSNSKCMYVVHLGVQRGQCRGTGDGAQEQLKFGVALYADKTPDIIFWGGEKVQWLVWAGVLSGCCDGMFEINKGETRRRPIVVGGCRSG